MAKHIKILATFFVSLLVVLVCSADSMDKSMRPLRMSVIVNNAPWSYKRDDEIVGILADRYRSIFQHLQISIEPYEFNNLLRPINELIIGDIDAASLIVNVKIPLPQFKDIKCTSNPVVIAKSGFYRAKAAEYIEVNSHQELNNYNIGLIRYTSLSYLPGIKRESTFSHLSPELLVRMLKANRLDIAYLEEKTAAYFSKSYNVQLVRLLEPDVYNIVLCLSEESLGKARSDQLLKYIDKYLELNPFKL